MNWGHGIALFFGGFVLFMVSLVVVCMRQDDLHLVTQNYYEEEIKYQQQIDKMANARDLDYAIFSYDATMKTVDLNLPEGAVGILHLFRPSDARLDQKFAIKTVPDTVFSVDLKSLKPGYWKMMLTWEEGGKSYYQEQQISI